ncbi:MAG: TRZ/ATZ family hydrolase [Pseudomonadota bacterium]
MNTPPPRTPRHVDQIIDARWIVPIEPADTLLENHSLVLENGRILDLLPSAEADARYAAPTRHHLTQHVVLPGFVNLHTHAAMTLLRGFADDMPLMRWLETRIWPAENRNISADFVHDGTQLACWEMLRGGITCFNDMYFFPRAAAAAVVAAGMRAALGITVFEFPSAYGTGAADYLDKGLAARESLEGDPRISFCLAPHAPYTVADATFARIGALSEQLNLPIHIHLHETGDEISGGTKEYGMRPLARLDRLGLLGPHLIAVHAVHLKPEEIDLLATHGCHIAHCPTSNMKLASGIAPVTDMLARGLAVGLGTDGAASNNRLDLLREMRHAALLAKVASGDAAALPAHRLLEMATLNGARALGLGGQIGSLLPGKLADLQAIRLDDWACQPCFDPVSHLVYVAGREAVDHVWVAGRLRIKDGAPLDVDMPALLGKIKMWHNAVMNSV